MAQVFFDYPCNELAITAFLVFARGMGRSGTGKTKIDTHDLMSLYAKAVDHGLKQNALVLQDLPHLSELHKIHYARYPKLEVMPVALISQFDDLVEQLFSNVRDALGRFGR